MRSVDIHYYNKAPCEEIQTQGWQELNDHNGYHQDLGRHYDAVRRTEINVDEMISFGS